MSNLFYQHQSETCKYSLDKHKPKQVPLLKHAYILLLVTSTFIHSLAIQGPPRITGQLTNQTAIEKRIVILVCEAEGEPKPSFNWFKDGKEISKKRTPILKLDTGTFIRLDPLRRDRDEGLYECQVENGIGDPIRASAFVKVLLENEAPQGFPKIVAQPPEAPTFESNSSATIQCKATGDPTPVYSWLVKGRPVEFFQDFGKKYTIVDGSLRINNLTENDKGEYECQATNIHGVATSIMSRVRVDNEYRPAPPDPPIAIKYRLMTPIDVILSWSPPTVPEHPARNQIQLSYQISLSKLGSTQVIKFDTNTTKHIVNDLSENTEYSFKIRTVYLGVFGPYSKNITFTTPKDVPPSPSNVKAAADSYHSAMVWWEETAYFSGIVGYRVYYTKFSDIEEADLDVWDQRNVTLTDSVLITNLNENSNYVVRVCSVRLDGHIGKLSEAVRFVTRPLEVPYDLKAISITTQSAVITWKPPIDMIASKFKISYDAKKEFYDSEGKLQHLLIPKQTRVINATETNIQVGDLKPYTRYRFNVTALDTKEQFRPPASINVTTPMAAPKPIDAPELHGLTNNGYLVTLPTASEEFGPIKHYLVIVVPGPSPPNQEVENYNLEELLASTKLNNSTYIAARLSRSKMVRDFTIGDNKTYEGFRNRPLNKNYKYYVFVRAVVDTQSELFTDSRPSKTLTTIPVRPDVQPSSLNSTKMNKFMLYSIALGLALFLMMVLSLFYKKQRQVLKTTQNNETTVRLLPDTSIYGTAPMDLGDLKGQNYFTKSITTPRGPFPINELEDHIEFLKMNNNLKEEYESIEPGQQFTWEHSYLDCNRPKNRYGNVVAYDHSRVVLRPIDGIPGSDYINASYCDGFHKENQYIATQGPLQNTIEDFWRMVWEQKSTTIVMMTQLQERGRVKCVEYWPSDYKSVIKTPLGITVTAEKIEELAYYNIRNFKLGFNNQYRSVRQFQFTAWPDHGVPDHPTPFLMFLKRVNNSNPADAGPMIVLCSAGVGRTGCFIVIDSMIERIKHGKPIDIYGHVTCLRAQRNYIVQTEDQYMFIHDAVLEAHIASGADVPVNKLDEYLHRLKQTLPGSRTTGIELEFDRLKSLKFGNQKFINAGLPCNKRKNRLMNILPYDSSRVCLEPIAGYEGSDYINANFCDGYRQRNAYIATQGPLPETVNDFWRMLYEHNSRIIVMLTDLKELGRDRCTQYWPAERYGDYPPYRVELENEYDTSNMNYILREFKITDSRAPNESRTIRQFHFLNWPDQIERKAPKSIDNFISYIAEVHNTREKFGLDGPITVHCSGGVGRTGVFIALSIAQERLINEKFLDLFEIVRTLRTQRPGMVQTMDQYLFCYETALEYSKKF